MVTLDAILASLARLEAGQMNILAAQDKLWQSLGAVERKLDDMIVPILSSLENRLMELHNLHCSQTARIDAGLRGVSDGCGLAIGELRKDFATRSASPLGGKARSGTKRRRAARRTCK